MPVVMGAKAIWLSRSRIGRTSSAGTGRGEVEALRAVAAELAQQVASCSAVSTPSATTSSPRRWPRLHDARGRWPRPRVRCPRPRRTSGRPSACRPGSGAGRRATSSRCRSRRCASCTPSALQRLEASRPTRLDVVHEDALGDLEHERGSAATPGARATRADRRRRAGLGQLAGREVDATSSSRPAGGRGCHSASCRQRLVEHPAAERHDQPGLLGHGDELGGREQARARGGSSAPAPRRRRRAVPQVDDGW